MIATPTKAKIEPALSAFCLLSITEKREIIAIYKKNNIKVEVNLASHTHQVPQVGFPHMEPLTNANKVKLAPTGAIDLTIIPATFALQTKQMKPNTAIKIYPDCPKIADGT